MSEGSTDGPFPLHPTVFLHRVCTFSSAALRLPREALPAHTPFLALPAAPFGGKPRLSSQPKRSALNDSHPPNGHAPVQSAMAPVACNTESKLISLVYESLHSWPHSVILASHPTARLLSSCAPKHLSLQCFLGLPCTFAPAPCST